MAKVRRRNDRRDVARVEKESEKVDGRVGGTNVEMVGSGGREQCARVHARGKELETQGDGERERETLSEE